jgi:hypothetical protein
MTSRRITQRKDLSQAIRINLTLGKLESTDRNSTG